MKTKDINKITGYQKVDTGMEARKYQDKEGEVYYVNVLGEHGDEGTARRYCIQNAAREFGSGTGTSTAAAYAGGLASPGRVDSFELWDGTNWTETTNMNAAKK